MRPIRLLAAAAALTTAGVAQAAVPIATTVTANGAYQGNIAYLNDGIFPANGSHYQDGTVFNFAASTVFNFAFDSAQTIAGFKLHADNNDDYIVTLYGVGETLTRTILASHGIMGFGTETFTSDPALGGTYVAALSFTPFVATRATVQARAGDGFYSIGEAQFFAAPAAGAVPEPATWAMMLMGFGLLGAIQRRTRGLRIRYPSMV